MHTQLGVTISHTLLLTTGSARWPSFSLFFAASFSAVAVGLGRGERSEPLDQFREHPIELSGLQSLPEDGCGERGPAGKDGERGSPGLAEEVDRIETIDIEALII